MGAHLRVYDITGQNVLGVLPQFTRVQVSEEWNGIGAMSFDYPAAGKNASLLDLEEAILAIVDNGVEQPDRYLLDDDGDDPAKQHRKARVLTIAARGILALFEDAVVFPQQYTPGTTDLLNMDPYQTYNTSPGGIMLDLIQRAQARGALLGVTVDFTANVDSAGTPWPTNYAISYDAGTAYPKVLSDMADARWIDYRMRGMTLQMYVPDTTLSVDRPNVMLRLGKDVVAGPRARSRRLKRKSLLLVGDEGAIVERTSATYSGRRREGYDGRGGITDVGTLNAVGDTELEVSAITREAWTVEYVANPPEGAPKPYVDYFPGDFIRYDQQRNADDTGYMPQRVMSIARTYTPQGVATISAELNDKMQDQTTRLTRQVDAIINGSTSNSRAPQPAIPQPDATIPNAPAAVSVVAASYQNPDGSTQASATISWSKVIANTDSTPVNDFGHYEIQWSTDNGVTWSGVLSAPDIDHIQESPFIPGSVMVARVRLVDFTGNAGGWTTSTPITVPGDQTAPPTPSAPVATAYLGVIRVVVDGLTATGTAQPPDFDHFEIYMSATTNFAITDPGVTRIDSLPAAGTAIAANLAYGTPYYFKTVAVDATGNRSAPSAQSSAATPAQVSVGDIGTNAIAATQLQNGAVTAAKVGFTIGGVNMLANSSFEDGTLGAWAAIGSAAPTAAISTARAHGVGTRSALVTWVTGSNSGTAGFAASVNVVSGLTYTFSAWVYVVAGTAVRLHAYGTGLGTGNPTGAPSSGTGSWQRLSVTFTATATGAVSLQVEPNANTAAGSSVHVDEVQFETGDLLTAYGPQPNEILPGTITQTQISDNAITTPKLAANAVTADKLTVASLGPVLVPNGGFEDADGSGTANAVAAGWTTQAGAARQAASAHSGGFGVRCGASASPALESRQFSVAAGDVIAVSGWAKQVTATATFTLRIQWRDSAGAALSTTDVVAGSAVPTTWTRYSGQAVAPANTAFAVCRVLNTAGSLDVDDIDVRPVVLSAMIGDGQIVATKLTVGSVSNNKVLNAGMEDVDASGFPLGWTKAYDVVGNGGTAAAGAGIAGTTAIAVTATTTDGQGVASTAFPVAPGDNLDVSVWAKQSASPGHVSVRVAFGASPTFTGAQFVAAVPTVADAYAYDTTNVAVANPPTASAAGYAEIASNYSLPANNTPYRLTGRVAVPAGATWARIIVKGGSGTAATYTFDTADARAVVGTTSIADAAIVTAKIADLAVQTAKIGALQVTNAKISDLSVGKLTAGSLTADVTIAARIKTADTGARVELNSLGLKAYDASGTNTVSINSDGTASFTGLVQTSTGSHRIALDSATNAVTLNSGATGEAGGQIAVGYTAASGNSAPYIDLNAPYVSIGGTQATLRVQSGSPNGYIPRQIIATADKLSVSGATPYGGDVAQFTSSNGAPGLQVNSTDGYWSRIAVSSGGGNWFAGTNAGDIVLDSYSGRATARQLYATDTAYAGRFTLAGSPYSSIQTTGTSYGSISIAGSTNGWGGITFTDFSSNQTLMMNNTGFGVYDASIGYWKFNFGGGGQGTATPWNLSEVGNIWPKASGTYDFGTSTFRWNNLYCNGLNAAVGALSGTTAVITSGNFLAKSSSSRRYKTRIRAAKPRMDLLDLLKPVTYHMKGDIEAGFGDDFMREIGLIAEDVHDAGLVDLVHYEVPGELIVDPDDPTKQPEWRRSGEPPRPESVKYDRLSVMYLPILKDLRDRLDAIEAQLATR